MIDRLENQFATNPQLKQPYEIVRTVGFHASAEAKDGQTREFNFRIEVLRNIGRPGFQALLWTADTDRHQLTSWIWEYNLMGSIQTLCLNGPLSISAKRYRSRRRSSGAQI